jgi:general secretion pathway protein J
MIPPPRQAQSGFTLLEVIIAVVVLGFVLAGLSQGTRVGINAWGIQTRYSQTAAEMERIDRVLRQLIEQATPPLAADDKYFVGQEHRLELVTRLPDEPQTDPIRRAQIAIGVDANHRLLLRWLPHPNAVPVKPLPPAHEIVLAEGIDHVDFRYRMATSDGGKWKTIWDDATLPTVVQIQIVALSANHHFPVIQAPTMLDTNGSF